MFVFELVGGEGHPAYQSLSIENLDRQYSFLRSAVLTSLALNRPMLSLEVIQALNFHAISCLHSNAGQLRPCQVNVGDYVPPPHWEVPARMNMFVDEVNRHWDVSDPVVLAAFVLWRLNHIHPFVNGNGRTARVTCYFVLCLKAGHWLAGDVLLPELIRRERAEYVAALKHADASLITGNLDLSALHALLSRLLAEQLPPSSDLEANDPG
jgi:Fic family protein